MFRKMPFILLTIILCVGLFNPWMPYTLQSIIYGISLTIKSLIAFALPFVVFGLLFRTAVSLANQATKLVLYLIVAICFSNFLSTLFSYSAGSIAYHIDLAIIPPTIENTLFPYWDLSFPTWIGNDQAMFSGLFFGIILGWLKPALAAEISVKFEIIVNLILKLILSTIPLFITGFVIKMTHDEILVYMFRNYAIIFALITFALLLYITGIYFFINGFQIKKTFQCLKNMVPAAVAGFGSMSSAAAMPLTILGVEKNTNSPALARSIIPATVNIHLIGDCFAIPIFAFAVMNSFGVDEPAFLNYLIFALYFVLAKFSVAAVPGGGILVMLPILENHLGFNADMLSLITALYILFDPVITCANILGNGGFAMFMDKTSKISLNEPLKG